MSPKKLVTKSHETFELRTKKTRYPQMAQDFQALSGAPADRVAANYIRPTENDKN